MGVKSGESLREGGGDKREKGLEGGGGEEGDGEGGGGGRSCVSGVCEGKSVGEGKEEVLGGREGGQGCGCSFSMMGSRGQSLSESGEGRRRKEEEGGEWARGEGRCELVDRWAWRGEGAIEGVGKGLLEFRCDFFSFS